MATNEELPELPNLARPSPARWLAAAALDWAIIAGALAGFRIAARAGGAPVAALAGGLALAIVGARQHALAVLARDGMHGSVCRSRRLNDLLANLVCLWPLGFDVEAYRAHDLEHHRLLGTPDDPELAYRALAGSVYHLPVRGRRFVLVNALLACAGLGGGLRELARLARAMQPRRGAALVAFWVLRLGAAALLLRAGLWWALLFWLGALPTTFWAAFRLRAWTEHVGTWETHRTSARLWERVLFVPHNSFCHYEHHRFPEAPFYRLPAVRKLGPEPAVVPIGELFESFHHRAPIAWLAR